MQDEHSDDIRAVTGAAVMALLGRGVQPKGMEILEELQSMLANCGGDSANEITRAIVIFQRRFLN